MRLAVIWTLALTVVSGVPTSLGRDAVALYDASGSMAIGDVMRAGAAFAPAASLPAFAEGSAPRVYWFRLRLARGASETSWALRYTYKVTQLDVYGADPKADHVAGGFDLAARDGAIAPGVLALPEWALRGTPIYVRVKTVVDPRAVTITPLPQALLSPLQRRLAVGFFVGFFLAIGAFNLLMFAILRDRSLANYAGVLFLSAIRTTVAFGTFWQLFPPLTFLGRELIYDTVALGAQVALAAFSIAFLKLAQRDRPAFFAVLAGAAAQLTVYLTDFFPTTTVAFDWTFVVTLVFFAALLFAGIRARARGMQTAGLYVLGVGCAVAGYVINMNSYALPRQDLWVYALEAGACLQALVLAMAVAQSVQESRAEHEQLVMESRHLEQLAMRDGLTGVLNRRSFDDAIDAAAARASLEGKRLGVLILDIDHFKEFNDSLGHQAGDEALRIVAQTCGACVRAGDVFARYGGEEFAAILCDASLDDLQAIAGRMCAALAAARVLRGGGEALTISIGGAIGMPSSARDASGVLRAADAQLYVAKNSGRNRVILCDLATAPA